MKGFLKVFGKAAVFITAMVFASVIFGAAAAAAPNPDRMWIDTPDNSYISPGGSLFGWAVSMDGITAGTESVTAAVQDASGRTLGSFPCTYGDSDPSVQYVYPGYPSEANCGFSLDLDTVLGSLKLTPGQSYTFTVIVKNGLGGTQSLSRRLVMPPDRMWVDTPNNTSITSGGSLSGWAISMAGIANGTDSVTAVVQDASGRALGSFPCTYGDFAPSVQYVYPGYPSGANCGFSLDFNTVLSSLKLTPGQSYTFTVIVKNGLGGTQSLSRRLVLPPDRMWIDTAENSYISPGGSLSGWAVSAAGIANDTESVTAVVQDANGQTLGSFPCTYGVSDPSVQYVYPGYPSGANCGFSLDLNTVLSSLKLTPGQSYTFTVVVKNSFGGTQSLSRRLVMTPDRMWIDTPENSYISPDGSLSGWAVSMAGVSPGTGSVTAVLQDANGRTLGTFPCTYGVSDPSVQYVYPGYPSGANCGFSLDFDTVLGSLKLTPDQSYTFTVVVKNGLGGTQSLSRHFAMYPDRMWIDTPDGTSITSGGSLSGWAISMAGIASGTDSVSAFVQDVSGRTVASFPLTYGGSYSSVQYVYPGYPSGANCGFSLDFNTILGSLRLTSGQNYTFIVVVKNSLGGAQSFSRQLHMLPDRMWIDTPNGSALSADGTLTGWAVSANGVQSVSVKVYDSSGHQVGSSFGATYGGTNTSVKYVYPGYPNEDGCAFSLNLGNILKSVALKPSTSYTLVATTVNGSGGTNTATVVLSTPTSVETTISYAMPLDFLRSQVGNPDVSVMDPTVLSQSASDLYQFISLGNPGNITVDQLNTMLSGCGSLAGQGQAFLDAANAFNLNPLYLIAHARLESGNGTSALSGNFNFYGICAYDNSAYYSGSAAAQHYGWTDVYSGIYGGAQWIYNNYIWGSPRPQYTLYMMRWDPGFYEMQYEGTQGSHQATKYATDPLWAHKIAGIIYQYSSILTGLPIEFVIPQFG